MRHLVDHVQQLRYLILLCAMLALLVVQPIALAFGILDWLFDLLLVVVMAALVFVLARDRVWCTLAIASSGAVATLFIASRFLTFSAQSVTESAGHAIGALFFVLVAGKIVASILTTQSISRDTVFAAICGYLLLGVAWGLTYTTVYAANPESYQFSDAIRTHLEQPGGGRDVFIYYSFVTLTTVGYGDISPVSIPARTLSWVEAVTGQLYIAVLIAGLISALVAKNMSAQQRS